MKIAFFGDVIGRPGREGLMQLLPHYRQTHDFVIVNAENAAHGKGLTPKIAEEFFSAGVDVLTLGNHSFDRKEILPIINEPRLLRPANYPSKVPGQGVGLYKSRSGVLVGVLQLMGRVYMPLIDCPFQIADQEIEKLQSETSIIFVDIHAEITAEKAALAWYCDGRVSAAVGTHTHVQTADERLLPKGTAFITDVGACGPWNSIIGAEVQPALERFLTGLHSPLVVAEGETVICGCSVEIDESTGHSRSIKRIREHIPARPAA